MNREIISLIDRLIADIDYVHRFNCQIESRDDHPERVLQLQKNLVAAKLQSQINFLKSLDTPDVSEAITGLAEYLAKVNSPTANAKRDLLTIKARAGQLYFRNYVKLFPAKYGFNSRRGGGLVMSNRYASDVINALLNYGYSVLAAEITKFVNGFGLDPYYGFMHKAHNSFQALVYDLIEPFRWLVEYAVYKLAVEEPTHGRMIRKDEYAWTRAGKVILDSGLLRRFSELLGRVFHSERPCSFKHGIKRKDGLSMCQEITIAKILTQELANYCIKGQD